MCHWPWVLCIGYYLVNDISVWGDKLGISSPKYTRFNTDRLVRHWVTTLTYKLGHSKEQEFPVGIREVPFLPLRHCDTLMWEILPLIPLNFKNAVAVVLKSEEGKNLFHVDNYLIRKEYRYLLIFQPTITCWIMSIFHFTIILLVLFLQKNGTGHKTNMWKITEMAIKKIPKGFLPRRYPN